MNGGTNLLRFYVAIAWGLGALLVTFRSAQAAPVQLSLEQVMSMAEAYAPVIQQAEATRAAQSSRVTHSYLNLGPKLEGAYNHVVFEKERTTNFGGAEIVISPKESRTASLTLAQPISGLFALASVAQYEGKKEQIESNKLDLTKAAVKFQAAEMYLLTHSAGTMRKVAEEALSASKKQVADARILLNAGRIHKGDLLKLELAQSNAASEVAKAKAAETAIRAQLLALIGLPLDSEISLAVPSKTAESPQPKPVDDLLKERKDVRAAELGVDVAAYGKKLAWTEFMPSISAFGKIDFNLEEPEGFGAGEKKTETYGVQATWQLWNNGVRVYKLREAVHQTRAAEAGFRQLVDQAKVEIVTAGAQLSAAEEALQLARTSLDQAREAHRIEQEKFRAGNSSATELVLAETSRTFAEGNLVAVSTELQIKVLRLQKAYGLESPVFQGAR